MQYVCDDLYLIPLIQIAIERQSQQLAGEVAYAEISQFMAWN